MIYIILPKFRYTVELCPGAVNNFFKKGKLKLYTVELYPGTVNNFFKKGKLKLVVAGYRAGA